MTTRNSCLRHTSRLNQRNLPETFESVPLFWVFEESGGCGQQEPAMWSGLWGHPTQPPCSVRRLFARQVWTNRWAPRRAQSSARHL